MKDILRFASIGVVIILAVVCIVAPVLAGKPVGHIFVTGNLHVDGAGYGISNQAAHTEIFKTKEYAWLDGNSKFMTDGVYFFAVVSPDGAMNPNDGGENNLSDDYDAYTNRTFTVANGVVSSYGGTHWLDDGKSGAKPNGLPPFIRLYPYADSVSPDNIYTMAVCYIGDGSAYPVDPRDCSYDTFKVVTTP